MSDRNDFMVKSEGPAKQFLVLVGDVNGTIRKHLNQKLHKVEGERDCFYLETYYYSAKYGIKEFDTLPEISKEFETNETKMMCFFVAYQSIKHLEEAKKVASDIKADMRVVIIDSLETCPEVTKVETFANANEFDIVYLKPDEEQRKEAIELSEKVGVERLIELIEVCNWPWRVCNVVAKGNITSLPKDTSEYKLGEDDVITGHAAGALMKNYAEWFKRNRDATEAEIPAPQHAERVHLSPDSPTTTEGTTNPDDVSISVDIDLICTKNQEEKELQRREDNTNEKNATKRQSSSEQSKKNEVK